MKPNRSDRFWAVVDWVLGTPCQTRSQKVLDALDVKDAACQVRQQVAVDITNQ